MIKIIKANDLEFYGSLDQTYKYLVEEVCSQSKCMQTLELMCLLFCS